MRRGILPGGKAGQSTGHSSSGPGDLIEPGSATRSERESTPYISAETGRWTDPRRTPGLGPENYSRTVQHSLKDLGRLVTNMWHDGVRTRAAWNQWVKSKHTQDMLTECLDYWQNTGMPPVERLINPHFHPYFPIVGLNYTAAAAIGLNPFPGGWTTALKHCRGHTFDWMGNLVANPFPKFFNYGESGGQWPIAEAPHEITMKLDGHLIIGFWWDGHWIMKTRGSFVHPSSIMAQAYLNRLPHGDETFLFELIHDTTQVVIKYDQSGWGLYLLGIRGKMIDATNLEVRNRASDFDCQAVRLVTMSDDALKAVPEQVGRGAEGFVCFWPQRDLRIKFKYQTILQAPKPEIILPEKTDEIDEKDWFDYEAQIHGG